MGTIRLKPPQPTEIGDYELDCVAIELGADETELDFRLELGLHLGIYWALPAERHDRLRLAHVDGAAYDMPAPDLIADPWTSDLALAWQGELGQLGNGRTLTAVRLELTSRPASYTCELVTRRGDAEELMTRLGWRADDRWHGASASTRVSLLDALVARLDVAPELDIGAIARVYDAGGRLFDEGYLDGAEYAAIHELFAAARSGESARIRAALSRCHTGETATPSPSLEPPPASSRARRAAPLALGPVASGHRGLVVPPAFSPDGDRFLAGDITGRLIVHERRGTEFRAAVRVEVPPASAASRAEVRGVAWSPAADRVASHDRLGVRLRDPGDLSERALAAYVGNGPIAFGGGGAWLAALGTGSMDVLAIPGLERRRAESVASGEALAADPAGDIVAFVDGGATEETAMGAVIERASPKIVLFQVAGVQKATIDPGGPVRGLVHDRWRGQLIANLFGGAVATYAADGALVRRFEPYDVGVRALAVTEHWLVLIPDRRPGDEATLDLWSIDRLERHASVALPGGLAPDWVVASPDGRSLVTRELPVRGDFGVRVWHIEP
jgi:hypothetical protein